MKRVVPLFFLALFISFTALADGGVYIHKTALAANVTIPDQRALLCWSNGTERLAIDTRFVGEGTNFAWVVPLPSQPKIEEATTGLFNTLDYIFRAPIVHEVIPLFSVLLFCTGASYLLLTVRRKTEPKVSDGLVSLVAAFSLWPISAGLAIIVAILLLCIVFSVRSGTGGCLSILVALFFLFLLAGMLLPALGTAGSSAVPANQVTVLERNIIGAYDTTTVSSKDPRALIDWLQHNDYVTGGKEREQRMPKGKKAGPLESRQSPTPVQVRLRAQLVDLLELGSLLCKSLKKREFLCPAFRAGQSTAATWPVTIARQKRSVAAGRGSFFALRHWRIHSRSAGVPPILCVRCSVSDVQA